MIEEFYFSMFDLDLNSEGGARESLGIDTFDTALLTATTELIPEYRDGEFTVYATRPGDSLQRLKGLALRTGARFIAWHGFPRWNLNRGAHILPAECMVRVR